MSPAKQIGLLAAVGALVAVVLTTDIDLLDDGGGGGSGANVSEQAPGADAPVPVVVDSVRSSSNAAVVEAVGTGDAVNAVTLHPESAGRVTEILFKAGHRVSEGDPLLRLDSEEETFAVELAEVHLDDARQLLARYEKAAPSGAVSSTEVDRARTALSAARIELSQATLALERRTLKAPFSGIVGIPEVDVGDRVTEETAIATLDDRSRLLVDFEVPEAFASGVDIGQPVEATTWALPGSRFDGRIDSFATRIDPLTRTLRVRAEFPNTNDLLRTGMSFAIRLPLQGERFPSVPSIAVLWDRRGAYVWRVADGAAERVEVDVLKREDQWILVDAPLSAGDPVVVEGVQRLRPGRPVMIEGGDEIAASGERADGD